MTFAALASVTTALHYNRYHRYSATTPVARHEDDILGLGERCCDITGCFQPPQLEQRGALPASKEYLISKEYFPSRLLPAAAARAARGAASKNAGNSYV